MLNTLENLPPILLAAICGLFTWLLTALGAVTVYLFPSLNKKVLNTTLGFAAGVMIAASFWSLLSPAIDLAENLGQTSWLTPSLGFVAGSAFVILASFILDNTNLFKKKKEEAGKLSCLLVVSVTLHNIPEGLVVGIAVGGFASGVEGVGILSVALLALGIGIQNIPEGAAVALPLRREGASKNRAFFIGQLSGFVELIFAILGAILAMQIQRFMPFALAFSAGAMIAVVAAELLPEAAGEHKLLATIGCVLGFVVMMALDVALG